MKKERRESEEKEMGIFKKGAELPVENSEFREYQEFQKIQDIAEDVKIKLEEKVQSLEKLNIIIMGITGVGKSTLINAIFG